MEQIKICIGADFVPTDINKKYFENGQIEKILSKEIINILSNADLNIFNLEMPLATTYTPIDKCGPTLVASPNCVALYQKIPNIFLGLANNHIMDQGEQGLLSTIHTLRQQNILYAGVGKNINEAKQPFMFKRNGLIVGIYLCAEHEFSVATENSMGANPFDVLECYDDVQCLKQKCDYVIVLYHGGKEYYRYPSPMLQRYCRKFIDKGADLIICQHSHCIGAKEIYNGGTIIYGQGNFLFNYNITDETKEFLKTGLLFEIILNKQEMSLKEIPVVRTEAGNRLANSSEKNQILAEYNERNQNILRPEFIQSEYAKFADKYIDLYLNSFLGRSVLIRVFNRLCHRKLARFLLEKKDYLAMENFVECEAHLELFLKGIKNISNKVDKK